MSAAGCAASCIGGCLGSMACCALKSGNTSDFRVSKFMALLLQATMVALTIVIQSTDMSSWIGAVPVIKECGDINGCYAQQVAYRFGFTTSCVFAFHLVLCLLGKFFASKALNSFWVFKFIFVIGGTAALMFVPNSWFTIWGSISDVALGWFLLIQMVWVLDFGYGWNDLWIQNANEDKVAGKSGKAWYIGILFFAAAFLTFSYVWYGLMFRDYASFDSNKMILWINLGVSTLFGIGSLLSPRGGILPSALVIMYIAWLSWSTVLSGTESNYSDTRMGVGLGLAFLLLAYSSIRTNLPQVSAEVEKVPDAFEAQVVSSDAAPAIVTGTPVDVGVPEQEKMEAGMSKKHEKESKPKEIGSWKAIVFINSMHLSGACYLMNLCISWKNSPLGEENMISYWIQATAAWVMLGLYGWTLIVPALCTSRQF